MLKLRGSEGHLGARHGNRSATTIRLGGFQFCHAMNSLRRLSVLLHNWEARPWSKFYRHRTSPILPILSMRAAKNYEKRRFKQRPILLQG